MDVEFDPAKDRANIAKHGVSLARAAEFDFRTAVILLDDRFDYGEDRWLATGFIADRLFTLVYVETDRGVRAISLRRSTRLEATIYAQKNT
jgi:uncharacterized DUF497 family protein